jgi:hypothetical protein
LTRQINYQVDPNTGLAMVLCGDRATLPDIEFTLGGKSFKVTPFEYIVDVRFFLFDF